MSTSNRQGKPDEEMVGSLTLDWCDLEVLSNIPCFLIALLKMKAGCANASFDILFPLCFNSSVESEYMKCHLNELYNQVCNFSSRKNKAWKGNIWQQVDFVCVLLGWSESTIQDPTAHSKSKWPMHSYLEWIYQLIWCTMIRVTLIHWSRSSQRNASWPGSTTIIENHSHHGASTIPINPWPELIRQLFWRHMMWVILEHWLRTSNISLGCTPSGWSKSTSMIPDRSCHAASQTPVNPWPKWIHQLLSSYLGSPILIQAIPKERTLNLCKLSAFYQISPDRALTCIVIVRTSPVTNVSVTRLYGSAHFGWISFWSSPARVDNWNRLPPLGAIITW